MRRVTLGILALALASTVPGARVAAEVPDGRAEPAFVQSDGTIIVESADPQLDATGVESQVEAVLAELDEQSSTPTGALPPGTAGLNGSIRASYAAGVPSNVRTVVSAALSRWDAALSTNVPIVVQVGWECFGNTGLLGAAGPAHLYTSPTLPTTDQYPVALANTLVGRDLNGAEAEIVMALNAELASSNTCAYATGEWYISTGSAMGGDQVDLYSVVLHELAHGFGFLGSAHGDGSAPALESPRYAYDTWVYSGPTRLVDTPDPNSHLTNGNLFYDLGGGHRSRIYAPSSFVNASSFSHFDFSLGSQPGALMTPALGNGEVHRSLDAPVLAVMQRLGWNVVPRAVSPVGLQVTSGNGQATINWSHNLGAFGLPPLSYRVDAQSAGATAATAVVGGTATSATLTGLPTDTNYTAVVTPSDARGWATGSRACFYVARAPSAPRMVRSDGIGEVRSVSWAAPELAGAGGGLEYTVQYRVSGSTSWIGMGTTTALSISTPTLAGVPHQFRVGASNDFGMGPWGYSTIIGVSGNHVRPLPLDGQISRLYSAYFGRTPEPGGFSYWLGQRAAGQPLTVVSAAFATAPEFQALYGSLSDADFVDLVYREVVGRAADPAGRAFWINYLQRGNSRGSMMIGFSESAEYVARSRTAAPTNLSVGKVHRLYLAFFQREPDAAGLSFWVGRLDSGTPLASIAESFVASTEFQSTYGCANNLQFVQFVYRNVLIREADAAGLSYWTGRLAGGMRRGDLMVGFSESPEFISRTGSMA